MQRTAEGGTGNRRTLRV